MSVSPKPRARRLIASLLAPSLLALSLVGGCAVGPDFKRPPAPGAAAYTPQPLTAAEAGGVTQSFATGGDIPAQWWSLYQSPALNRLVEQALKANPDLEAAQAALRAAHETYLAQRGALLPTVDLGFNASRQQASATPSAPLSTSQLLFNLYNTQVNVAYTPDVFGAVRRQTESVAAQAEAQRFATEATQLTLTANVVAAAIQEASLRQQIAATRAMISEQGDVLAILRRQMAVGQASGGDVAAQEAALAQTEQALPPLEKSHAQTLDQIAALIGRSPDQAPAELVDLDTLVLPHDLPVSLPSKLVDQRPDVRLAEANLHSASAQVGVAVAARLPAVTLGAGVGGASTNIGGMFTQANSFWSLAGGVTQPIFQGGALLHRQRAAEASFDQAKAQYRSTVLSAFQNVADSLQALQADAGAVRAADRAVASATTSLRIAEKQLEVGEAGGLAVLTAQQAYQQAVISRLQAQASRYADTAALFQALGGGWWNRTDKVG